MPLITPDQLMSHSLRAAPHGEQVAHILAAALHAVEPGAAVHQHLQREQHFLTVGTQIYDLRQYRRVLLLAFGKAALPMALSAAEILGQALTQALIIPKAGNNLGQIKLPAHFSIQPGSHPLPDERSQQAARQAVALLATTRPDDLLLCLVSGGGSALLSLPVPGVSLADLQQLTRALLACGAKIEQINTLRKHLSQVKGGQLACLAAPAQVATLILSDVVGDPLAVIASGPTVPDPGTYHDALQVLKQYALLEQVPANIRRHLERGAARQIPETPKPGDPLFDRVQNLVIGNNRQAALAALVQARQAGFNSLLLTSALQGEACRVGPLLAAILHEIVRSGNPLPRPACLIAGGETTVTLEGETTVTLEGETTVTLEGGSPVSLGRVAGAPGLGGRNQELALSAVIPLAGLPQVMLVTLATDGEDGPTDAAGAVVSGESLARARQINLDPVESLARHDAYHFFQSLGDLLQPGSTGTNVNDLSFLFAF